MGTLIVPRTGPDTSVACVFEGDQHIATCQHRYFFMLWDGVSKKIATSCIEFLHTIEDEAIKVLKEMEKTDAADISLLKDLLGTFFDNLRLFNSTRSSSAEKISEESQAQLLTDKSHNLNNAETQE